MNINYKPNKLVSSSRIKSVFLAFAYLGVFGLAARPIYADALEICSFNIQFIGLSKQRDDTGLAELLKKEKCDIVVIQELLAPPDGELFLSRNFLYTFPVQQAAVGPQKFFYPENDGQAKIIKPADKSTSFFQAMAKAGFNNFILSPQDTGISKNQDNSSKAEWPVAFFKDSKASPDAELPNGFLETVIVGPGRDYDRTPYAFGFRGLASNNSFVLISVHLHQGRLKKDVHRRAHELESIFKWVSQQNEKSGHENNFIVLGDVNTEKAEELTRSLPDNWRSLNSKCLRTNTAKQAKCYDHVLANRRYIAEIPEQIANLEGVLQDNFEIIPLIERMRTRWFATNPDAPYPGGEVLTSGKKYAYNHNAFRAFYSDHNPVKFKLLAPVLEADHTN